MANIKNELNNIKGALYGKDVRSSIHDGIDAINKEVESTTGRQVDLEKTFDQLVINAGNSNAEIVDARVKSDGTSYPKLGDRLNEVDSQLEHNENSINNLTLYTNEQLFTKMDNDIKIKSSQLDTSVNDNKIKMINLSDEVREAMTGNASVSPVIDDLSITNEKYANNSIDYSKLKYSFADVVEHEAITIDLVNLEVIFNKDTTFYAIENRLINSNQQGKLAIQGVSGVSVLYLDGNNIMKNGNLYPNNLPENAKIVAYIYATSDSMAGYKYNVITKSTKGFKIIDKVEPPQRIPLDNSVTLSKMANPYCYNLLNNSITIDLNNKKVEFNETVYIVCYDALYSIKNHPVIDFSEMSTDGTLVLTFDPINKTFEFKSLYPNNMTTGIFILGYLYKDNYVDSFISLNNKSFNLIGFTNSKSCSKWGVIGDSITHANSYQLQVINKVNIGSYENNAIIGSCIASNSNPEVAFVDRYLETPQDCDLITIMGGINDCNSNIPIGDINNKDRTTYIGAYQEIIEGLLTRNPNVRIMLFTPTPYWKNTAGRPFADKMIDYVNATKDVANYYGLPCLDLYNSIGINEFTKNEFMTDMIHYNSKGYKRMGNLISSFIESNL